MTRSFFLLSIVFLLCLVSQSVFAQQDNFLKEYLQRWENSHKYLIGVAEAMPDSNYKFKPAPNEMTFAEQLMHIALGVDWQAQTLIGDRKEGDGSNSTKLAIALSKTLWR